MFTTNIVIGLEIHAELNTKTKLFCGCPTKGNEDPNTRTCPTCLGMPGSKPILNKSALLCGIKTGLALNCELADQLIFSRKSYFYPDMAKNFQITQYELPLGRNGSLKLSTGKKIGMTRIHLEEDPASLVHPGGMKESQYVLVDYNRSGNPLIEMVTEPDLESPEEARDFLKQLITVLDYLGVFDVDNGIIKADANVSIKESKYTRVEIKNITGFKEIERALHYEVQRQQHEIKENRFIVQETRSWDAEKGATFSLRKKETEADYGYIIDPDLVEFDISKDFVKKIKEELPELAEAKLEKFKEEHGIEETTAQVLAKDKRLAEMYEAVSKKVDASLASKWIRRELPRVLNYQKKNLEESGIKPEHMISLLKLIEEKKITDKIGQKLINKLGEEPFDVEKHVKEEGLSVVSDQGKIEKFCKEAIKENPQAVEQVKAGEKKAINFIIGKVMQKTKGKADPTVVKKLVGKLLG